MDHEFKIKVNDKIFIRLIQSNILAFILIKNFWKHHINNVAIKLSTTNAMLSKISLFFYDLEKKS